MISISNPVGNNNIPLVVDLDGTLINTDLLFEALILLLKKNPIFIFKILPWLFKGKVYLKNKIFGFVHLQYDLLPYNKEVLNFLEKEFSGGRKIILATASPVSAAIKISEIHPIFSEVYGTENKLNLKGFNKLELLINQFGEGKFDYIGNSKSDIVIFSSCRYSYLVGSNKSIEKEVKQISNLQHIWMPAKATLKDYLKEIRAYQWIKNLLLFVPLITSHSFRSLHLWALTFVAFCTFSLVASAGYLLNDLFDMESDRKHPRKKFRLTASGKIPILKAFILSILFLCIGLFFATKLNLQFFFIVLLYFLTSFSYSIFLKKIALYDIFILAVLYSIRVFAGALVIDVYLSFWLIAFSTFIFLSLAFVKRCSELIQLKEETNLKNRGRGYDIEDIKLLEIMGIVSGFLAVVVFALYINSPEVTRLYSNPKILWAISFLFLFWISHIWLFTVRGKMTDDPILFAIKDRTSYFVFLFTGLLLLAAL